jgi:2-oxoglutarate ferredoxin oxidoreductase subunit gamma
MLIVLSQEAYAKYAQKPAKGTLLVIDSDLVKPDSSHNPAPLSMPATRMAREIGRPVVANIIMLGFLAAVSDLVSAEALRKSILSSVPKGTEEFNMKAFELGYDYGRKHRNRS